MCESSLGQAAWPWPWWKQGFWLVSNKLWCFVARKAKLTKLWTKRWGWSKAQSTTAKESKRKITTRWCSSWCKRARCWIFAQLLNDLSSWWMNELGCFGCLGVTLLSTMWCFPKTALHLIRRATKMKKQLHNFTATINPGPLDCYMWKKRNGYFVFTA